MRVLPVALTLAGSVLASSGARAFDAAAAFGARPSAVDVSLSPDGSSIAFVAPTQGMGSVLYTVRLDPGAKPKAALTASGKPERLGGCDWVSNDRLVCRVYGILKDPSLSLLPVNRLLAVNADGSDHKLLSTASNFYTRGFALGGGNVIDWMPERDGAVLMSRHYLPDEHIGSRVGSSKEGLGVDLLDTRTLQTQTIERPLPDAVSYISDGHGTVRVMGVRGARAGRLLARRARVLEPAGRRGRPDPHRAAPSGRRRQFRDRHPHGVLFRCRHQEDRRLTRARAAAAPGGAHRRRERRREQAAGVRQPRQRSGQLLPLRPGGASGASAAGEEAGAGRGDARHREARQLSGEGRCGRAGVPHLAAGQGRRQGAAGDRDAARRSRRARRVGLRLARAVLRREWLRGASAQLPRLGRL